MYAQTYILFLLPGGRLCFYLLNYLMLISINTLQVVCGDEAIT